VYKKRTELSNGSTKIDSSPTFFHLKPKIPFLNVMALKKEKRRTISKTPIRLTLDTVKIRRRLNFMHQNGETQKYVISYCFCTCSACLKFTFTGLLQETKTTLICIMFILVHFYTYECYVEVPQKINTP